jgi:hypothetical protein
MMMQMQSHNPCSPLSHQQTTTHFFHFVKDRTVLLAKTRTQQTYIHSVLISGGGSRDRTDDPRLAKPVLSQLSYAPLDPLGGSGRNRTYDPRLIKTVL